MTHARLDTCTFDSTLNGIIREIYENATLVPMSSYRRWAVQELLHRCHANGAAWGTACLRSGRVHTWVDGGESLAPERLFAILDRRGKGVSSDSRTYVVAEGSIIVAFEADLAADLVSFLAFCDGRKRHAVGPNAATVELLAPHCFAAWRQALSFGLLARCARVGARAAAIMDRYGAIHAADARFHALLRGAASATDRLPTTLCELNCESGERRIGGIHWRSEAEGDWIFVSGEPLGALGRLTERERSIVDAIVAGQSYVQSATSLGISVHTVRNTLARVYRKLGVRNKVELTQRANVARSRRRSDANG